MDMIDINCGKSSWILCPVCRSKTRTKIFEDTVLIKFPLYCPKCRREIIVDVAQFKMLPHREPDV